MANYYVDLSLGTDGHAGTGIDPFSFADLLAITQIEEEDSDFYCKGTIDFTGSVDLSGLTQHNYYAWEPYTNGPPRIRCSGDFTAFGCQFYGFILSFNAYASSGVDNVRFYGCYILSAGDFYADLVVESTLNVSRIFGRCRSSLIKAGSGSILGYMRWCAADTTGWTVSETDNSQIDWVYPTFPAWDAPKEDFNIDLLLVDVDTPPQPGDGIGFLDLWGMTKNNIGTGYFVPTYVDLEASGTGHAGTELDPYSYADWVIALLASGPHTYNMRGIHDNSGSNLNMGGYNNIIQGWDLTTYGPWRLSTEDMYNLGGNARIQDGIINFNTSFFIPKTMSNCYIISRDTVSASGSTVKGSTIQTVEFDVVTSTNILIDCCIKADAFSYHFESTFNNCALNGTNGSYVLIDSQTDWIAPAMPVWDADQSAFDASVLYADIDTPPQQGTPPYLNYSLDLWGNARTGIGAGNMLSATAPVWISTYPKVNTIGGTGCSFDVEIDQDGTAYFVVVPYGASAPSAAQVKAGQDSTGSSVASGFSGSTSLTANTEGTFSSSGLSSEVHYDVYFIAETTILQDAPVKLDFTTTDVIAPVWISTYPKLDRIKNNVLHFLVKTDSTGNAYFVVVLNGAIAPSSVQVKAGQDSTGASVATGYSSSVSLIANTEATFSASVLYGKTYDIYFVAEDSLDNLQSVPVKVEVNLPQLSPVDPKKPGKTFNGITIAGRGNVDSKLPKIASFFRSVSLPNMRRRFLENNTEL